MSQVHHVIKRGVKGIPIVRDKRDREYVLKVLYYFNHKNRPDYWHKDVLELGKGLHFKWPEKWGKREERVEMLSFCLLDNHLHLLIGAQREHLSSFLHDISLSISHRFNVRYKQRGNVFERPLQCREITSDEYLMKVDVYIHVKNAFEMYPGGLQKAFNNFDKAFDFASRYPYCSLGSYVNRVESPILNKDLLSPHFGDIEFYKEYARDQIERYLENKIEHSEKELLFLEN